MYMYTVYRETKEKKLCPNNSVQNCSRSDRTQNETLFSHSYHKFVHQILFSFYFHPFCPYCQWANLRLANFQCLNSSLFKLN